MRIDIIILAIALVLTGAISGFFYSYWCSVMIGLDAAAPETGLAAMQAINRTVRNIRFAPAFFGPLAVLPLAALAAWRAGTRAAASWCLGAFALYFVGVFLITVLRNVPLNMALAPIQAGSADAVNQWRAYLADWSFWNGIRTIASFMAMLCVGAALLVTRPAVR